MFVLLNYLGARTALVSSFRAIFRCGGRGPSVGCGGTVRTLFVLLLYFGARTALVSSFRAIDRCGGRGPSVTCGRTVRTLIITLFHFSSRTTSVSGVLTIRSGCSRCRPCRPWYLGRRGGGRCRAVRSFFVPLLNRCARTALELVCGT